MGLNPDFVGRTYSAAEPYLVGREKVREFASAIGDDAVLSHDPAAARAAGFADVVAPPTFAFAITPRAMGQAMFDPALGLDYSRVVHGEQRFSYSRPIVAGDELAVTATIEGIRSVAGNDMLTTKGVITTVAGEPVATATSMLLARGADA